ncbi:MAG TPA: YajG family lipoprotein [Candidatus Didemnitutus sp.]|nr:YajG family lipoprotein [Candidatus Didemnitutus sp.]
MKHLIVGALIIAASLTSGCVTGRRVIGLEVPSVAVAASATRGDAAVVGVSDQRAFANKPDDPAVPSVDGDVNQLSPETKAIMIGRQRNTYGHSMGDIALGSGQTVSQQVKALVESALKSRGYNVTSGAGAATTLNVSIDQFWAWFTPGFVSVTFEARVYCKITVTKDGKGTPLTIEGYGKNSGQIASDDNWKEAYARAYKDFETKLATGLEKAGF